MQEGKLVYFTVLFLIIPNSLDMKSDQGFEAPTSQFVNVSYILRFLGSTLCRLFLPDSLQGLLLVKVNDCALLFRVGDFLKLGQALLEHSCAFLQSFRILLSGAIRRQSDTDSWVKLSEHAGVVLLFQLLVCILHQLDSLVRDGSPTAHRGCLENLDGFFE